MGTTCTDDDSDSFWNIALSEEPDHRCLNEDSDGECADHITTRVFHLPNIPTPLYLSSLPELMGAWSPVGAQVWHASGVLASLEFNLDQVQTVLEIGSGAVGLSGLALAFGLGDKSKSIILTDLKEDGILDQLGRNVRNNVSTRTPQGISQHATVHVQELDWCSLEQVNSLPSIDLVIGSELVYTNETSKACAFLLQRLLLLNPNLQIAIVQVLDRPGWLEFLDCFPNKRIAQPLPLELHDRAMKIIGREALGTLSRDDYGLCLIANDNMPFISIMNLSPDLH